MPLSIVDFKSNLLFSLNTFSLNTFTLNTGYVKFRQLIHLVGFNGVSAFGKIIY